MPAEKRINIKWEQQVNAKEIDKFFDDLFKQYS